MNWQPIETAPAGKSVLACNALGYVGRAILLNGKWEHIGKPTHWMPLPAAPGAPAGEESFEDRISDWAHGDALDAARWRELLRFVGGHYSTTQGVWFSVTHLKAVPGTDITDGRVEDHFTKAVDAAITDRAAKETP
jgi:hypothetical protein